MNSLFGRVSQSLEVFSVSIGLRDFLKMLGTPEDVRVLGVGG